MKNVKLNIKSRNVKFLLGLAAAGALLLASCQNIFDPPAEKEVGYGMVSIDVGAGAERTITPDVSTWTTLFPETNRNYIFKQDGEALNPQPVKQTVSGTDYYILKAGTGYTIQVEAYDSAVTSPSKVLRATGESDSFDVTANVLNEVKVKLHPNSDSDVNGTFGYNITNTSSLGVTYSLEKLAADGTLAPVSFTISYGSAQTVTLAPGSYVLTVKLYNNSTNQYGGFSEVIQIYPGLTTTLPALTFDASYISNNMATIASKADAVRVLKEGIKTWVTGASDVLALEPYFVNETVANDGTVTTPNKVTLYYFGNKIPSSNVFPLTLNGGWAESAGTLWATAGLVDKVSEKTITLKHAGTSPFAGDDHLYTLVLVPVVKYNVTYNANTASTNSNISFARPPILANIPGVLPNNPISINRPGSVTYGAPGTTVITITRADITIKTNPDSAVNGTLARPVTADTSDPTNVNTYTLFAESQEYFIQVHQRIADQFATAANNMKTRIETLKSRATDGIIIDAITTNDSFPATETATPNVNPFIKAAYVADSIVNATSTFPLSLDGGWSIQSGTFVLSSMQSTTDYEVVLSFQYSTGAFSTTERLSLKLDPIAQYKVTFDSNAIAAGGPTVSNQYGTFVVDTNEPHVTANGVQTGDTAIYFSKVLGAATVITVPPASGLLTISDKSSAVLANSVSSGAYTFSSGTLASKVYTIKVYPSRAAQISLATNAIRTKNLVSWVTSNASEAAAAAEQAKLSIPKIQKFASDNSLISTDGRPTDPVNTKDDAYSALYYIGGTKPNILLPTALTDPVSILSNYDAGFTYNSQIYPLADQVKFKPMNADPSETDTVIYNIYVKPVVQFVVKFDTAARTYPNTDTTDTDNPILKRQIDIGGDKFWWDRTESAGLYGILDPGGTIPIKVDDDGLILIRTFASLSDFNANTSPTLHTELTNTPDGTNKQSTYSLTGTNAATSKVYEVTVYPSEAEQISGYAKPWMNQSPVGVFVSAVSSEHLAETQTGRVAVTPSAGSFNDQTINVFYVGTEPTFVPKPSAPSFPNEDSPDPTVAKWQLPSTAASPTTTINFKAIGFGSAFKPIRSLTLVPVAQFKVEGITTALNTTVQINSGLTNTPEPDPLVFNINNRSNRQHFTLLSKDALISSPVPFEISTVASSAVGYVSGFATKKYSALSASTGNYEDSVSFPGSTTPISKGNYIISVFPLPAAQLTAAKQALVTYFGSTWASDTRKSKVTPYANFNPGESDTYIGRTEVYYVVPTSTASTTMFTVTMPVASTTVDITASATNNPGWAISSGTWDLLTSLGTATVTRTLAYTYRGLDPTTGLNSSKPTYQIDVVPVAEYDVVFADSTANYANLALTITDSAAPPKVGNLTGSAQGFYKIGLTSLRVNDDRAWLEFFNASDASDPNNVEVDANRLTSVNTTPSAGQVTGTSITGYTLNAKALRYKIIVH